MESIMSLENLNLRELQKEAARALTVDAKGNNELSKFNKLAHHNSQQFYKAIIQDYIDKYGDLPSKTGPGKDIKLVMDTE